MRGLAASLLAFGLIVTPVMARTNGPGDNDKNTPKSATADKANDKASDKAGDAKPTTTTSTTAASTSATPATPGTTAVESELQQVRELLAAQAQVAVASAQRVLDMADARYQGGVATYLDVITAQQSLLTAQLQAAQLAGQRQIVATALVKALGGVWQASS